MKRMRMHLNHALEIKDVCQEDSGLYTVVLKNSAAALERRLNITLVVNGNQSVCLCTSSGDDARFVCYKCCHFAINDKWVSSGKDSLFYPVNIHWDRLALFFSSPPSDSRERSGRAIQSLPQWQQPDFNVHRLRSTHSQYHLAVEGLGTMCPQQHPKQTVRKTFLPYSHTET